MKNLFLLILFFGLFFGAQFVYFENRYNEEEKINFDEISSSIVTIESLNNRGKSFGSGVIISEDGYIITAFHNLSGNLSTVKIAEKTYLANLIGFDEYADLAVLKINEENLNHIKFSDQENLEIGQTVYAIGNPYNIGISVSRGILSATGRNFGNPYLDIIQTDAAINKGNSGGPMFDSKGNLIGINTAIFSTSGNGGSIGIGFAIPTNIAASVINQLKNTGQVVRGWLGVNVQYVSPNMAEAMGMREMQGAYVVKVEKDSPASKAKIKEDDIIISFDGKKIKNVSDLPRIVGNTEIGKLVKLIVLRNEKGELVEKELIVKISQLVDKESNDNKNTKEHAEQTEYLGFKLLELKDAIRSKYKLSENIEGILILGHSKDSKNKDSGFIAGDIITKLNQESVSDIAKFKKIVGKQKKDGKKYILLTVKRNNITIVSTVNIE